VIRWLQEQAASRPLWQIDAVGAATCAALAGVWALAGLSPLTEAKAERERAEASLRQLREECDQLARSEGQQDRELLALRQRLETAPMRLCPVEAVNQRVSDLAALAAEHGLRIDEIKPGSPEAGKQFVRVPIKMAGAGSYEALAGYLHAINKRFQDTGVARLDLRGEPEAMDRPARYSVELTWHALPTEPPAKK
jgi:Tfp pilus assembly protein PilO